MRSISIEAAADIAMRLAADAVANAVAGGGDDGFDARFHRRMFLAACADVEARESKARAIRADGTSPALITPPRMSVDPNLIASAVAAAVAEERATAGRDIADRKAGAAMAESETDRLAAEIAAFTPSRIQVEGKLETAEDMAAQIAAFAPSRGRAEAAPQ